MTATSTPRDAERLLRSQGFSRKAAKIAVAGMRSQGMLKEKPKQNLFKRLLNAVKGA